MRGHWFADREIGAIVKPLAYARGSDRSCDRKGSGFWQEQKNQAVTCTNALRGPGLTILASVFRRWVVSCLHGIARSASERFAPASTWISPPATAAPVQLDAGSLRMVIISGSRIDWVSARPHALVSVVSTKSVDE